MAHEMQHEDSPTWCKHCGTFDIYCDRIECSAARPGNFDSQDPETFERMFKSLFPAVN